MELEVRESWQVNGVIYDDYKDVPVHADPEHGYAILNHQTDTYEGAGFYDSYWDALYDMKLTTGGPYIAQDRICILHDGEEIVYWHEDEWIQDHYVTTAIANTIEMYYEYGAEYIKDLLKGA